MELGKLPVRDKELAYVRTSTNGLQTGWFGNGTRKVNANCYVYAPSEYLEPESPELRLGMSKFMHSKNFIIEDVEVFSGSIIICDEYPENRIIQDVCIELFTHSGNSYHNDKNTKVFKVFMRDLGNFKISKSIKDKVESIYGNFRLESIGKTKVAFEITADGKVIEL